MDTTYASSQMQSTVSNRKEVVSLYESGRQLLTIEDVRVMVVKEL